jgi:hypothetical protein
LLFYYYGHKVKYFLPSILYGQTHQILILVNLSKNEIEEIAKKHGNFIYKSSRSLYEEQKFGILDQKSKRKTISFVICWGDRKAMTVKRNLKTFYE